MGVPRQKWISRAKDDIKGAIHSANNNVATPDSNHISAFHHCLWGRVANGEFEGVHVPSAEQHSDVLAKPLRTESFRFHRNFVMNLLVVFSFVCFSPGIWGHYVDWNGEVFRELDKVVGVYSCVECMPMALMIVYTLAIGELCAAYRRPDYWRLYFELVLLNSDGVGCCPLHILVESV